jgi:SAM-dependent methyltransferase
MTRYYRSKFQEVIRQLDPRVGSLLDVGCRDGTLRRHLPPQIVYTGVDLSGGPHVDRVCDVERGLPFPDASYDVVTALDVLEHTDNIWYVFDECLRVARLQLMIVLPNSYHWKERLRFLRGREGDKHRLPGEPIRDRHRWWPSNATSLAFARRAAERHGLTWTDSVMVDDRRNLGRELLARILPANLMAVATFITFVKPGVTDGTGAHRH